MALETGARIDIYEVTGKLGEGAMGEVYRARDTTLDRDVALKVLPDSFTADPERLGRFQREAKVLASLNHPNIGGIYGLETSGDNQALVLELIEGPTLAERIAEGPIPVEQGLAMVRQIAEALSAAHDAGVVHRDLKPANIKVRPDGTVKVLDFGLAKAVEGGATGSGSSDAATMTAMSSQAGAIIGTAAYMSPEQARGQDVDKRSDIWALGCVAYELLTGHRPFEGSTLSDTLASVLARDVDWSRLPEDVPPALHKFLKRCLEKDATKRLRDATEGILQLEDGLAQPVVEATEQVVVEQTPLKVWQQPAVAAGIALVAVLLTAVVSYFVLRAEPAGPGIVARSSLTPPPSQPLEALVDNNVAISRDGMRLVYRGLQDGTSRLYVRALADFEATALSGLSNNPRHPFLSPDGTRVGFFDGARALQRVSVLGGPPVTIVEVARGPRGASWGEDDRIVFATGGSESGLMSVAVAGGEIETLSTPNVEGGERNHMWPDILPGGEHVLFTILTSGPLENAQVAVFSFETGEYEVLFPGGSGAKYVPTGHIVYGVGGTLRAVGFDLETLTVTTEPIPVIEDVLMGPRGAANFAFSDEGALVYVEGQAGTAVGVDLVWVDTEGVEEVLAANTGNYRQPRLSPDGNRMAVQMRDTTNGNSDIFIYDISRNNFGQFTFDDSGDCCPLWTPDGMAVVWTSNRGGAPNLYKKNADGTGEIERIGESSAMQIGTTWTRDDAEVIFGMNGDLFIDTGDGQAGESLFESPFFESLPRISPDGRWIAYQSDEDGDSDIYVRPFPEIDEGKWKVSAQGGSHPVWSANGDELYFAVNNVVMAASVETEPTFNSGNPSILFQGGYSLIDTPLWGAFDFDPSTERFLVRKQSGSQEGDSFASLNLTAVFNWFEELSRSVPNGLGG